ncbi:hypothetical protein UFOVP1290_253 [uncultured Caudovirales phage]|uniref:Uncharacterized protein n=1 Tax=uncultured Caudovirales phage TaxID=2100421 RepID=A0A6J5RH93_9CAUD|nr:hypothetical protein UFOVP1290_253 [uncultured Caudovirales phage]
MVYAIVLLSIIITVLCFIILHMNAQRCIDWEVLSQVEMDCIRAERKCEDLSIRLKEEQDLHKIHLDYFEPVFNKTNPSEKLKNLISLAIHNDNSNESRNAVIKACQLIAKDIDLK